MYKICSQVCSDSVSEVCMEMGSVALMEKVNNSHIDSQQQSDGVFISYVASSRYLRALRNCERRNERFTDHDFPPNSVSLGCEVPGRSIIWQRISTLAPNLIFMQDDISSLKIEASNPNDTYFLPTISALSKDNGKAVLFSRIFLREWYPNHKEISRYGIYRVVVKVHGVATEVLVDDWIPVYRESGRPVFSKLVGRSIWILVLEKVWAKLKGSYGAMLKGSVFEVLNTFCLAPTIRHNLTTLNQDQKDDLWKQLTSSLNENYILCAATRAKTNVTGLCSSKIYAVQSWREERLTGRRIYFHNIASQIESASSIGLPEEEEARAIFSLSYQTFLLNFQTVDVNCVEMGYHFDYSFTVEVIEEKAIFLALEVRAKQTVYITVEKFQRKRRELYDQHYGESRVMLAKKGNDRLQYIASQIESSLPTATLICNSLEVGSYLIMIDAQYPKLQEFSLTLSFYSQQSNDKREITLVNEDYEHFMHEVMLDYALRVSRRRINVPEDVENSLVSMDSLKEGGYAYVVLKSGRYKMKITFDAKMLKDRGFYLATCSGQIDASSIEVKQYSTCVLVFKYDLQYREVVLPENAFAVYSII